MILSKEIEDAIKGAIKLEIDGKKFFNHAAEITSVERGKKMFQWLAAEEVKHLEIFSKLFTAILKSDEWKKHIDADRIKGDAPLIKKLEENMKREGSNGEIEALRIGMELERNAIEFFQKAASATDDQNAVKIFTEISEEEKFHYDMLEAQLDSVTKSGFWLGSAEFKMDGQW
jgi:rubrerythrin